MVYGLCSFFILCIHMETESNYCLFVNQQGVLVKVYCEFQVICLVDVHNIAQGEVVYVSSVLHSRGIIVYLINNEMYYNYYFSLYPLEPTYAL